MSGKLNKCRPKFSCDDWWILKKEGKFILFLGTLLLVSNILSSLITDRGCTIMYIADDQCFSILLPLIIICNFLPFTLIVWGLLTLFYWTCKTETIPLADQEMSEDGKLENQKPSSRKRSDIWIFFCEKGKNLFTAGIILAVPNIAALLGSFKVCTDLSLEKEVCFQMTLPTLMISNLIPFVLIAWGIIVGVIHECRSSSSSS